ncbi:hypothetical protein Cgig2_016712 [Carnegiea gigantea]|uniref:Cation/H+ exchanger transmembrane domain-containing protein n=1 Tax=Carnegiea gigantea TaxID=171969 RepID=A0A9Q1QSM5_9CARY|nr:hypothetical protein Cgig2_016712 [Carnegiea gigantea]
MEMELLRPSLSPFVAVVLILTFHCSFSHSFSILVSNDSIQFDTGNGGNPEVIGNATDAAGSTNSSGSFADMFDRALEKEFTENEQTEVTDPGSFNNSVAEQQAVLETVARVRPKKNETKEDKPFQLHQVFKLDNENGAEDTPTLIDRKDNVFIISNPKSKYPILQLDLRLISELVVVIVSATCGGIAFACAGQPVITGYLLAGSIIGPGGFSFVTEMVQVETVAQFGVIFLLFALGLEFSTSKLRVVRAVAIVGGILQIFLFISEELEEAVEELRFVAKDSCTNDQENCELCGGKTSEGVFVGLFLSMSSTAVVLKFLMERNSVNALHGQVTIGTLILQDCTVGLLFAFLPVLGGTSGVLQGVTNELYQLASVAFCLLVAWVSLFLLFLLLTTCVETRDTPAWYLVYGCKYNMHMPFQCSDKLGLSLELGSFAAGVMISTTDLAQHTLEQIEPIRNFFAALFLASIGMLIHVHFLWNHVDILLAAVILVIIVKTIVVAVVVKAFGYNNKTSLLVGMSLAQIGEFAFVLLSRASNLHLVEVTTPLLFKLIPAVVHLGVLLRWFAPDSPSEVGYKGELLRADSAKRIALIVQGSHDS